MSKDTDPKGHLLSEQISPATTKQEFEKAVEGLLTNEDKRLLGPDYMERMLTAVLYLVPFGPADFDYPAYSAIVGVDDKNKPLPSQQVKRMFEFAQQQGFISITDRPDRFTVPPNISPILSAILDQYEE